MLPSWLVLSWALTLGIVPQQVDVVAQGQMECADAIRTDMLTTVAELRVEARALDHIRLWGAMENYQYFSGFPEAGSGGTFGFLPFRADYTAGLAIFAGPIELGIRHECDHPVVAGVIRGNYLSMETQIYLTISGSTD